MRTLGLILFFPFALLYMATFSLFIMPILYAKNVLGILGFIPLWLINFVLSIILSVIDWILKTSLTTPVHNYLNKLSNACLGYGRWRTVSSELGDRIDNGKASCVSILHCRILATYDPAKNHCSEKAKALF